LVGSSESEEEEEESSVLDPQRQTAVREDRERKKRLLLQAVRERLLQQLQQQPEGDDDGKNDGGTGGSGDDDDDDGSDDLRRMADALRRRRRQRRSTAAITTAAAADGAGRDGDDGDGKYDAGGEELLDLDCVVLSGGVTNYSYKVFLADNDDDESDDEDGVDRRQQNSPPAAAELSLFAKVCFPYALWNPDRSVPYDLARVENEFAVMKRFAALVRMTSSSSTTASPRDDSTNRQGGGEETGMYRRRHRHVPVAKPYFCIDVPAAETATAEEAKEEDGTDHGVTTALSSGAAPPPPSSTTTSPQMKILVCQWAPNDCTEQWANQFVDGRVDSRVVRGYARALATLNACHVRDDELHFNDSVRPCMLTIFPTYKEMLSELCCRRRQLVAGKEEDDDDDDEEEEKCAAYCRELGEGRLHDMVDGLQEAYMSREMLVHSDTHAFNVLCEPPPPSQPHYEPQHAANVDDPSSDDDDTVDDFSGTNGYFVICDWEMAMIGPKGRDTGIFLAWPLSCAFAHAAAGRAKQAYHLLETTIEFWSSYRDAVLAEAIGEDKNKTSICTADATLGSSTETHSNQIIHDEGFLRSQFRSTMGFASKYLVLAYYLFQINIQHLPFDDTDDLVPKDKIKSKTMASIGYVGLRLGEYGFLPESTEPDLTLEQLRRRYSDIVESEIKELLRFHERAAEAARVGRTNHPLRRRRRSSMLRASGRRISDAGAMEQAAADAAAELVRRTSVTK